VKELDDTLQVEAADYVDAFREDALTLEDLGEDDAPDEPVQEA
jgi:hypothetical protein